MPTQTMQATKNGTPVMNELVNRLNSQIDNLAACANRLESAGHRFKNTNAPENPSGDQTPSTGFLSDFNMALERMAYHNERLVTLANKLEEII